MDKHIVIGDLQCGPNAFAFFTKNFGKVTGTYEWLLFQSVSAVWAISKLLGGGDTKTLIALIEFVWTFCTHGW